MALYHLMYHVRERACSVRQVSQQSDSDDRHHNDEGPEPHHEPTSRQSDSSLKVGHVGLRRGLKHERLQAPHMR